MRVQDLMTKAVETVSPRTSAEVAFERMRLKSIHHLAVMEGTQLAGVLSDRDMGGRQGASLRKDRTVADLMTRPVVNVQPTTPIRRAANLMRGRSIGCLIVTDKSRVVGIVTAADLLELLGRGGDRSIERSKRWTLKHRAPHRKRTSATGAW